jgi:glycosyltransferase involved in cell wall biosynthesis
MKLLYLTGDYLYSKVHNNLIKNLLEKDPTLEVYVFSPVRSDNAHGLEDSYYNNERLKVVTPKVDIPILLYQLDFWAKQRSKVRQIEQYIPIREIDVIHAATMFSEGGTAYRLNKMYGIPYLVSIRGADVMTYARKMPHLWPIGNKILKHAAIVSCVTPSIKERLLSSWKFKPARNSIEQSQIINNGIDAIWTENINLTTKKIGNPARILYIGRFDKNKNVLRLVEAVKLLKKKHNVSLTLIGGKGEEHDEVVRQVQANSSYMEFLGPIYDKERLMGIVRQCDLFAMVSHSETFGLVYAECLSQGLPLLYTKGTGFDEMYPQGFVGYGVDSYSAESIKNGLGFIIDNYDMLRNNISNIEFKQYSWSYVAKKYLDYYIQMKNEQE